MSRLIDLDDDRHVFCGEDGDMEKWNIDPELPIIEAIPVKYILNKCPLSLASDSSAYNIAYINDAQIINRFIYALINDWRREQAERK